MVLVERNSWFAGRAAAGSLELLMLLRLSEGTGMAAGTKSGGRPMAARALGVSGD